MVTSHFPCKCKHMVTKAILLSKVMAELGDEQMSLDEQVHSVISTASNSLEAIASSSNTLLNHPNKSKDFFPTGCSKILLTNLGFSCHFDQSGSYQFRQVFDKKGCVITF